MITLSQFFLTIKTIKINSDTLKELPSVLIVPIFRVK